MLLAYLKRQYKLLLLLAGAVCIFAAVFALYDLPLEAVLYAGALCLALGLVLFAVGYSRFLRRHWELAAAFAAGGGEGPAPSTRPGTAGGGLSDAAAGSLPGPGPAGGGE